LARARPIAILFDLDGTLVDTVPFILAAVRHAFDGYGRCPTDAEWIAGIGTPLRTQLGTFVRGPDDVEPLFQRYRTFWLANHDERTRAFPGALEVVGGLAAAGHPVGVVTAKIEQGALRTLAHVGLLPHVQAIVGADSCARSKPHPEPVLLALSRLGRPVEEALLLGDSPHDVAAAKAAGTVAVGALWGACDHATLAAAGADHLLEHVRGLPPLVGTLQGRRMGSVYVLVVDDNDLQRDVVADALSSVGYEVAVAANGADALREARARHPDVIVLDLMLPDTDGATVLAELRADPALARVRVLVTTGVRAASVRRLPGVDLALFKPFGMSELLAAVESLAPPRAPAGS
jgi:pyrophosphatase PpaX